DAGIPAGGARPRPCEGVHRDGPRRRGSARHRDGALQEGGRATGGTGGARAYLGTDDRSGIVRGNDLELPEVEVMRRDLEKDVVGRRIKEAEVKPSKNAMRVIRRHPKRKDFTSRLEGRKIAKVERRGKYLVMPLDSGDVLVTHFGMSGQFQRGTGRVAMPPHTHVVLTFQQGGDLRYIDPRTFGEMFVSTADEVGKIKELQHLAIDPLDQVFTWPTFQY